MRKAFVSISKELPEGLTKTAVGHGSDMDANGTYGRETAGDMEKAADDTEQAFNASICKK